MWFLAFVIKTFVFVVPGRLGRGGAEFGGTGPDSLQSPAAPKPDAGPQEGGWAGGVWYCRWAPQWYLGTVSRLTVEFIDEVPTSHAKVFYPRNDGVELSSLLSSVFNWRCFIACLLSLFCYFLYLHLQTQRTANSQIREWFDLKCKTCYKRINFVLSLLLSGLL